MAYFSVVLVESYCVRHARVANSVPTFNLEVVRLAVGQAENHVVEISHILGNDSVHNFTLTVCLTLADTVVNNRIVIGIGIILRISPRQAVSGRRRHVGLLGEVIDCYWHRVEHVVVRAYISIGRAAISIACFNIGVNFVSTPVTKICDEIGVCQFTSE